MESDRRALQKMFDSDMWKALTFEAIRRVAKDNPIAEKVRKEGNKMFMSSSHDADLHEQILKMYTISIAAAENKTESLAMCYGNRSAILLHIGKCEASIRDIDRALEISKNDLFKIKMLCRKMECMHALDISNIHLVMDKAKTLLDDVSEKPVRESYSNLISQTKLKLSKPSTFKIFKDKILETLGEVNKNHSINDFSSVELQYCERYGRHLVATRDFAPGEVIYIEKPYVMFLNQKKLHAYCSYCFSTKWANIPCDHCSWTMFCSEECKKKAWSQYHDIECSVYACAQKDEWDNTCKPLAIRLFIMALRESGGLKKLKANLEALDQDNGYTKGFIENGKIKTQGFKSIYTLIDQVPHQSMKIHLQNTAMILRSIARNSTLFGENFNHQSIKAFKKSEDVLFIGALILKLSRLSQLNKHQMWNGNYVCRHEFDRLTCWKNECCTKGSYIAPVTSLLNHSCDPNVRRCFSEDKTVILYAIHPIRKGSQLFDCYQQEYYELDRNPRQRILAETYNFKCDCIACQKRWPHLMTLFQNNNDRQVAEIPPAEQDLVWKYRHLVPSTLKADTPYSLKDITFLGEGIKKGLVALSKPSFCTVNLIICLNTIFERLCGIWFRVPDTCQKS